MYAPPDLLNFCLICFINQIALYNYILCVVWPHLLPAQAYTYKLHMWYIYAHVFPIQTSHQIFSLFHPYFINGSFW